LAELIEEDSQIVIRLKFDPAGKGHSGDEYYLSEKQNRCIVCGFSDKVARFSVIPHSYRTFFVDELKSHSSHDIVLLCAPCHRKASTAMTSFHKKLLREYNLNEDKTHIIVDETKKKITKLASALLNNSGKMPQSKIEDYREELKELLQIDNLTEEDIINATKVQWKIKTREYMSPSKIIVDCLETLEEYQHFWREMETILP